MIIDSVVTMKVLHIWDHAGVSGILATYQRGMGYDVEVIKRDGFDPHGINEYYGIKIYRGRARNFYFFLIRETKNWDLIHFHADFIHLLPFIRKPIVLHFHGSELRNRKVKISHLRLIQKISSIKEILVATPDLLSILPHATWLPTPIDTEHFSHSLFVRNSKQNTALYIHNWYESGDHAGELAERYGLELTVLNRAKNERIPYEHMPEYLSQFEYFIDRKEIHSLSKTGLEALMMGLKVIKGWTGKRAIQEESTLHYPDKVAEMTLNIYKKALHNGRK